jgi:hypothetical protein
MLRQISKVSTLLGNEAECSTALRFGTVNESDGRQHRFSDTQNPSGLQYDLPQYDLPQYDLPEHVYDYDLPQYDLPQEEVGAEGPSHVPQEAERLLMAIAETDARVAAEIAAEDESLRRHLIATEDESLRRRRA